jgi:hypothetical protein
MTRVSLSFERVADEYDATRGARLVAPTSRPTSSHT